MTSFSRDKIEGRVWKFGHNVDTDVIIPARFCNTINVAELGFHAMSGIMPGFAERIARGDIICAGCNFGCGSSREPAPMALLGAGVGAVVAMSFGRIFFRNSINVGLPIFEAEDACRDAGEGDLLLIDPERGKIVNETTGAVYMLSPYPEQVREIIASGGMVNYVRRRLGKSDGR